MEIILGAGGDETKPIKPNPGPEQSMRDGGVDLLFPLLGTLVGRDRSWRGYIGESAERLTKTVRMGR